MKNDMSIQARAQRDSRSAQEQAQGDGVREASGRPHFAAFVYLTNVMGAVRVGGGGNLFNRLADLIEPEERTCRMIDNGVELCCSECDGRHSYDDEPDYCMRCGAKVVYE